MNSMTKNKKGLISLFALLITIAMLVTGTYAWFTDTATVKGNKVYAGMLTVDVVATVEEILNAFAQDYYGENFNFNGSTSQAALAFNNLGLKVASTETSPAAVGLSIRVSDGAVSAFADIVAESSVFNDVKDFYCKVTDKEVPVMNVSNVEPGATYPVKMHVMNSGELAIAYAAGFSIDPGNSKTGLEALDAKYSSNESKATEEYKYLNKKLTEKQLAKNPDGTDRVYSTTMAGVEGVDLGGHLEDVLEVYSMTEVQYTSAAAAGLHGEAMKLEKDGANANYIGTISQIIHCNDAAYKMTLDEKVSDAATKVSDAALIMNQKIAEYTLAVSNGAIGTTLAAVTEARDAAVATHAAVLLAYNKLYAEQQELPKVADRLASAASGYCVPESKVSDDPITVYERDGSPRRVNSVIQTVPAISIGTAYFAIHMPGSVDNFYQNAMLTLNAGITASQVELDEDGIHVMVYDDRAARLN